MSMCVCINSGGNQQVYLRNDAASGSLNQCLPSGKSGKGLSSFTALDFECISGV